jgi:lipoprotein-releasing system permease protein
VIHSFEFFIARRYLRAKRKQAVISIITVLSVLGVAAGVMALVVALAVNNGFRNTLQRNLLGATAHVTVLEKEPGYGIDNWHPLVAKFRAMPHVVSASPSLYGSVYLMAVQGSGVVLKGVPVDSHPEIATHITEGSFERLKGDPKLPGLVVGRKLADMIGMKLGSEVKVIVPQGETTPFGAIPTWRRFRVVAIYDSGFFDLDSAWVFTSLEACQAALGLNDVVNAIELRVDDIYRAEEIAREAEKVGGPKLSATHWMEQNRQLLNALRMEKAVTVITIGLIQLVAALNILIALVMMVMEKYRDISILLSMGARREQIRRIFMAEGVLIGVVGTVIGLVTGYTLCYFANRYQWIRLDESVYSLSFVPFEPRTLDAGWIALVAIVVSFLATIYPAVSATRIVPVEALRYE